MFRVLSLAALTAIATAQGSCTSFATLVHGTSGAPQGLGTPDCSYIQANAAAICNTLSTWDIINGNACQMRGPGYGCQFSNAVFSTQETFYCQLGPAATETASNTPLPTSSSSASPSATHSPSSSPSPSISGSGSASASPMATPTPSASASASASPVATISPSGSASVSASAAPSPTATVSTSGTVSATATATSTSTHTINPVYIYINTTTLVPVSVTDSSISKGSAAAIGLAAIFGTFTLGCVCLVVIARRRPAEKEPVPIRRPSSIVIRETASRRPSVVGRDPVTPSARRPSTVLKSQV